MKKRAGKKKKEFGKSKKSESNIKTRKITLKLDTETDIAMDFATKVYKKFNKILKSVILFGSTIKKDQKLGSDIDIVMIIDDVTIKWDQELIAWYREELNKILVNNPYNQELHINTIKLSIWWKDLLRGDPVVINIIRYGEAMIDFAGFFDPLKFLLVNGEIKSTPEAIHTCLQRAPMHFERSRLAELNTIEGLYWAMVDSAHAALIAANVSPPSPEHVPIILKNTFVADGRLKMKYISWYRDLLILHKKIVHRQITDLKGVEIDEWQEKTQEFINMMAKLVNDIIKID